jgi:hypothetical protein
LSVRLFVAQRQLAELEQAIASRRGAGLMLAEDGADKLARYEGHLERSLYRALHELERRQAARGGADVPLAAVLDVTVSAPDVA